MILKKKTLAITALALITLASGCYKTLDTPSVATGDCQYTQRGLSLNAAQTEMARVIGIFQNARIGNAVLQVKTDSTFVSTTKSNGTPVDYGFQIVFSCDEAGIQVEGNTYYDFDTDNNAYNARLFTLNRTQLIKVIDGGTSSNTYTTCSTCTDYTCDTCYDSDGNGYDCNCSDYTYDCNCSDSTDYSYSITYAKLNAANHRQAVFIQSYEDFNTTLKAINGGKRVSFQETLKQAGKFLPKDTIESEMVTGWYSVLSQVSQHPKMSKNDQIIKKILKTGKTCKIKGSKRAPFLKENSKNQTK